MLVFQQFNQEVYVAAEYLVAAQVDAFKVISIRKRFLSAE